MSDFLTLECPSYGGKTELLRATMTELRKKPTTLRRSLATWPDSPVGSLDQALQKAYEDQLEEYENLIQQSQANFQIAKINIKERKISIYGWIFIHACSYAGGSHNMPV